MERMKKEKEKFEWEKDVVYNTVYLPVRFFKKEAYIHIDHYKEVRDEREKVVEGLEEENKELKEWKENLIRADKKKSDHIDELEEENKKLSEEIGQLKSDLEECECSMHFENDEVGYRKRECKKLNIKVASLEGEIKGLNYTIEKLKEENQTLESDGYKM